jgi:hypothetical protein
MLSEELDVLTDAALSEFEACGLDPEKHAGLAEVMVLTALKYPVGVALEKWLQVRRAVNDATNAMPRIKV